MLSPVTDERRLEISPGANLTRGQYVRTIHGRNVFSHVVINNRLSIVLLSYVLQKLIADNEPLSYLKSRELSSGNGGVKVDVVGKY